jgi:hypothetical protein
MGLRAWLQRLNCRPEQGVTLEISRNQATGQWDMVERPSAP